MNGKLHWEIVPLRFSLCFVCGLLLSRTNRRTVVVRLRCRRRRRHHHQKSCMSKNADFFPSFLFPCFPLSFFLAAPREGSPIAHCVDFFSPRCKKLCISPSVDGMASFSSLLFCLQSMFWFFTADSWDDGDKNSAVQKPKHCLTCDLLQYYLPLVRCSLQCRSRTFNLPN